MVVKYISSLATYINPSLKNQHLMPRPLTVRKRANSLCGFILICHKEVVKAFEAKSLEEPFSIYSVLCLSNNTTKRCRYRYIDQIMLRSAT